MIFLLGVVILVNLNDDTFDSIVDEYGSDDFAFYKNTSDRIFAFIENEDVLVGETIDCNSYENQEVLEDIFQSYKSDVQSIHYVEPDVVFITCRVIFS